MDESVLSLDEAVATAATGDIWLFRGRSLADRAIQTVTNSPVNHVGMVVARKTRIQSDYEPDEIRDRLRNRIAETQGDGDGAAPAAGDTAPAAE